MDASLPVAPAPSRRDWILAGSAAFVVFLFFEYANEFVAVPLREISSIAAQALLDVIGFPISRHGTILSTPRVTFDVVPACSGSTTLQVLLFLAIVWCGVHPRLTMGRRAVAILLAVPLAILANSIRVAGLVAIGHAIGDEPDDFIHAGTGVVAFMLAMMGCFLITRRLASNTTQPGARDRTLTVALGALVAFLGLPFLTWCVEHWSGSSIDRYGFIFLAVAGSIIVWKWRAAPDDWRRQGLGTIGLGASLLLLGAATLVDVNILKGFALAGTFLSLALARKGVEFALGMIPVTAIAYLGFPTVSYQIGVLTSWKLSGLPAFLVAKTVLAVAFLGLLRLSPFRSSGRFDEAAPRTLLPWQVLMVSALAAFQAYFYGLAGSALDEKRLDMSYIQGDWTGRDLEPPRSESDYFGRDRIWFKRYGRQADFVEVLVTSTGGDRHRAHPPAYCLSALGWKTTATETLRIRIGDGVEIPMTRLRMRDGDKEMFFFYWFTTGTEYRSTFSGMLLEDTLRRLGGQRADWFVFRVMSASGEPALHDFLSNFKASLVPISDSRMRP